MFLFLFNYFTRIIRPSITDGIVLCRVAGSQNSLSHVIQILIHVTYRMTWHVTYGMTWHVTYRMTWHVTYCMTWNVTWHVTRNMTRLREVKVLPGISGLGGVGGVSHHRHGRGYSWLPCLVKEGRRLRDDVWSEDRDRSGECS